MNTWHRLVMDEIVNIEKRVPAMDIRSGKIENLAVNTEGNLTEFRVCGILRWRIFHELNFTLHVEDFTG